MNSYLHSPPHLHLEKIEVVRWRQKQLPPLLHFLHSFIGVEVVER